jgi:acyl carrier protein
LEFDKKISKIISNLGNIGHIQGGLLEIKADIRGFIENNFMMGRDPKDLTESGSLLEMNIIDSTGVLELVSFLEENFNITIEDDELVPENLDTIDRMANFINRKKQ